MSTSRRFVVLDRVEAGTAVLVSDEGTAIPCSLSDLPEDAAEGTVLSVAVDDAGHADLETLRIEEAETSRRLDRARAVIEELKERDPGGDVTL